MSTRSTTRIACLLLLVFFMPLAAFRAGVAQNAVPAVDRYGDPLPAHAQMRIGTTRLRTNITYNGNFRAIAFTGDGKRLVLMSRGSGVQVWDIATGKKSLEFGKPSRDVEYVVSDDGSIAAIIESETICRFYDTADGKVLGTAQGDWHEVKELRFSPDNKFLVISRQDRIEVWNVAGASKSWQLPFPKSSGFGAFAFSGDGALIVSAPGANADLGVSPNQEHPLPLLLYDIAKGPRSEQATAIANGNIAGIALSPDGKTLAAGRWASEFVLWNFATGKLLHEPKSVDDRVWCLRFSPNGKWIVTGSNHGRVRLWDIKTGQMVRNFLGSEPTILSVAFSPDSKYVAASSDDDTFRIWEIESGKPAFEYEGHRMRNVQARFIDDGKTIVSICGPNPLPYPSEDERLYCFWDATTGKLLRRARVGDKEHLRFCLSGDGKVLYVIDEGKITKKNLENGNVQEIMKLPPSCPIYCSADGRYLAVHTDDFWGRMEEELLTGNSLKVLDTTIGKEVFTFDGIKGEVFYCRFTEDGRYLAVHSRCYETDGQFGQLGRFGRHPDTTLKESYLTIWDVQTGRKTSDAKLLPQQGEKDFRWPGGDALSPDRTLALGLGKDGVELRELATNTKLAQFPSQRSECKSWTFSQDGRFVAVGNEKGEIFLSSVYPRSAPPKLLATLTGHIASVTSVHFSPDGRRLISGSDDTTIIVWDIAHWTAPAAKTP